MLSQGHMGAHLYCYTGQVGPSFGNSGWSEHDVITSCLRLISTSDHFTHPYFEPLICCLKGIWVSLIVVLIVAVFRDHCLLAWSYLAALFINKGPYTICYPQPIHLYLALVHVVVVDDWPFGGVVRQRP